MFRKFFAVFLAISFALGVTLILFSDSLAQNQNNLVANSTNGLKTPGDTARSQQKVTAAAALITEPDYPDPTVVRSLSDEDLNNLFDRMSTHYSRDAVLFNNVGAAYFQRKEYEKAGSAVRHAIILNDHPAFLTNLSIIYDAQHRYPEAISAAQRAVNQAPKYARARSELCELLMTAKRTPDTVLCYQEMSKMTTLDPASQTFYSVALLRSGEPAKAIEMIEPLAMGNQPTALMFNVLGGAYFARKRYKQASDAFKRGVEMDPDSAELRYNLAMALSATDNRPGAMSQYNLMKDKDPKLADQLYRFLYRDEIIFVDEQTAKRP